MSDKTTQDILCKVRRHYSVTGYIGREVVAYCGVITDNVTWQIPLVTCRVCKRKLRYAGGAR